MRKSSKVLFSSGHIKPPCWDLLDENTTSVIEQIVEDEDQDPSKKWGPYRWYCYPTEKHILKTCKRELFGCLMFFWYDII